MPFIVDLNADIGESFGRYTCGMDEQVLAYITSANIACGYHASDPVVMERTVRLAAERNVRIGAHPGFPDLMGFGRRAMAMSEDEIRTMVMYQIGALGAFCRAAGVKLQHVKPHGALYNIAAKDPVTARAICRAAAEIDPQLVIMGQSGSCLVSAAEELGLSTACEVFADRASEPDGTLVARSRPGAMITDAEKAAERVLQMVTDGTVTAADGSVIRVRADTICIHGDSPSALAFAASVRAALDSAGIECRSLKK